MRSPGGSVSSVDGIDPTNHARRRPRPRRPSDPPCGRDGRPHRCREWLEHLDLGEPIVVNLWHETDPETEYVSFDPPQCCGCWLALLPTSTSWPVTHRSPRRKPPRLKTPRPGGFATANGWRSRTRRRSDSRFEKNGPPCVPCWICLHPGRVERARSGASRLGASVPTHWVRGLPWKTAGAEMSDASVDQTEACNGNTGFRDRRRPRRNLTGA